MNVKVTDHFREYNREVYNINHVFVNDGVFAARPTDSLEEREELLCLICFSEIRNLVNLPCGHACVGEKCIYEYFENGDNRECPLCRASTTL